MEFKVKKKNIVYIAIIFPIIVLVSFFVSLRSSNFNDYEQYKIIYENYETIPVEVSYSLISQLFHSTSIGFYGLLFLYALLGIGLKISFFYKYLHSNISYFIVIILCYLSSYFILWDLIQIRFSVAVGFLIWGIFTKNKLKYLYLILSILFHYSMVAPISIFLIISIIEHKKIKFFLVLIFVSLYVLAVSKLGLMSQYSVLENTNSKGINFLGFFVLSRIFVFSSLYLLIIRYRKKIDVLYQTSAINASNVALSMFLLFLALAFSHPLAGERFFDIGIFLILNCAFMISFNGFKYILFFICSLFISAYLIAFVFNPYGNSLIFH